MSRDASRHSLPCSLISPACHLARARRVLWPRAMVSMTIGTPHAYGVLCVALVTFLPWDGP